MRIGIPTEIKPKEGRVGLIPAACSDLVRAGHEVFIQSGAGEPSGYGDDAYRAVGVEILPDAAALYGAVEMVVKVKEPIAGDLQHLRADHRLFCFLHLAAEPKLSARLQEIGLTAVAFETVEEDDRRLPLLAPMSDIAGRIASQAGVSLLYRPNGGKGLLLGGLPAAERGRVAVLGGGVAGHSAALVAASLGAEVTVFDLSRDRLEQARAIGPNVTGLYPYAAEVSRAVAEADLLVGAVLVTGARAPHLVSKEQVASMQPGSVIVDISVDQGGCIETTRPTTWEEPTYVESGVLHYAVTNMPGAVPRSASQALSAALIPYVQRLAQDDWEACAPLARGLNVRGGEVVHPALLN